MERCRLCLELGVVLDVTCARERPVLEGAVATSVKSEKSGLCCCVCDDAIVVLGVEGSHLGYESVLTERSNT